MWWIIGLVVLAIIIIFAAKSMNNGSSGLATSTDNNATTTPTTAYVVPSENRSTETVFSVAESLSGSSQFAALLKSTGVDKSLGTTTYTVFVPTDIAWNKAPKASVSGLTAAQKKRLAEYHIIVGRSVDTDAMKFGTIQAMSNDALNFSVVGNDKTPNVNSSSIVRQYKAKNGIVYVIDAVLLPPIKK